MVETALRLNLGANDRRFPGFISVDIVPPADQIADLTKEWPWPDSSVDEIVAYDVFEHLPDKRHTMNELWRVLKPGAKATIQVPDSSEGDGADCDPTHVSRWNRSSFEYCCVGTAEWNRFHGSPYYGIKCAFKKLRMQRQRWERAFGGYVIELLVELECIK